jgi:hypothetical protein
MASGVSTMRVNKKAIASFELVMMITSLFAFSFILYSATPVVAQTALSQPSACCEKTDNGAYCINSDQDNCDESFKSATTSCETTSYCKLGTCYDSQEGICMENTPLRVCNENGGTWDERDLNEVPQCQLGCCIIADQAAFVPLVRCKRLSTLFGVSNDYRTDINSEINCIATAQSQDKGACVYEKDFERFCEFTTRSDCGVNDALGEVNGTEVPLSDQRKFYKDYLCSAEELNTACARQTSTTCSQGDVFWVDSCGNLENVYSADRDTSWNMGRVTVPEDVCDASAGDKNCGNCDYLLGTRCEAWDGFLGIGKPDGSDHYCQSTECTDRNGDKRINGESWCVYDSKVGGGTDLVGSRYFREICVDGDVRVEPCEDYRNHICIESSIETGVGDYGTAACRVNRWQECIAQTDEDDCLNVDRRDCNWLPPVEGLVIGRSQDGGSGGQTQAFSNPQGQAFPEPPAGNVAPLTGQSILGGDEEEEEDLGETTSNRPGGVCVPNFSPGLKFWEEGSAPETCGQANARCVVRYEKGLFGDKKCVEGCECLEEEWAVEVNQVCASLGDCGGYANYENKYTDDGYKWLIDEDEKKFTPNTVNKIVSGVTGAIVSIFTGKVIMTGHAEWLRSEYGGGVWNPVTNNYDYFPDGDTIVLPSGERVLLGSGDSAQDYLAAARKGAGTPATKRWDPDLDPTQTPILTDAPVNPGPSVNPSAVLGASGFISSATDSGAYVITEGGAQYLVTGGDLAAGEVVPATNLVTGEVGKLTLSSANLGTQTVATVAQTTFGTKAITLASGETTMANILANPTLTAELAKNPAALEAAGLKSISSVEGGTQLVGTDGSSMTVGTDGAILGQIGAPAKGSTFLSRLFGMPGGGIGDALFSGLQWAAIAGVAGYMIGGMLGLSENNQMALAAGAAAGAFAYKAFSTLEATSGTWLANPLVGIGIGVVVFALMYKKESAEVVTFSCMPWQAPNGGDDCEKCNDPDLPCSEYRCKSLGQNCEIENVGTTQERCVNVNPNDVNPPIITPNENELSFGHSYQNVKNSPPGPGFEIVNMNSSDGCLKAFTPLKFGITTDEPAQCKIDFNHTLMFDDMVAYFGGSNLYAYNHSEQFALPGADMLENSSFILENGKDLTFFIRCKDKNGNENGAEYAARMCIDPSPDNTAPQVKATSVANGGCVAEDQDTIPVEFYTNEPSDCRWSHQDQSYDSMQGEMLCSNQLYQVNAAQLFTCKADLTGVARDESTFYVRCKDQPEAEDADRNENRQSFVFNVRGSTALKMKNLQPNETIFGAVNPAPVELYVETLFGCNEGKAICYYSKTGDEDDYIMFFDTNTEDGIHTQRQDLVAGNHEFFIKCVDEGGNLVEDSVKFKLDIDTNAPVIARIYQEDQMLKIVTVRDSECSYSFNDCDFTFAEGTEMPYANSTTHIAEWNEDKTYYVKCRDEFRNEDADCSAVIRPTQNFL